jgi:hypothetical protein
MLEKSSKKRRIKIHLLILVSFLCITLSGCALLQVPGQLIGGTFSLLGKVLDIAKAMPKPPPGVFF